MIEQIYIINLSHYDIGYTDHPVVSRKLQSRYLDMAIDLVRTNPDRRPDQRFYWTCESNDVVLDWWQSASQKRQKLFVEMVRSGWIDVCAMPFNHGPTLDGKQWRCLTNWLTEELWQALKPKTIVQSDVNGFPRAGIMALMDRGAEFLWMGLNCDTGGSPLRQPSAFWWEMPDGRKIFVWNSVHYCLGYFLFEATEWRKGPLPQAADTRYRPPEKGDILSTSLENLKKSQEICWAKLEDWYKQGYSFNCGAISLTNMWRIDNDPPCALLADFVSAWNDLGLTPKLIFTTATKALNAIKSAITQDIPVLSGEWTNWWANGVASTPRELSASRQAKRILDTLDSRLYERSTIDTDTINQCRRQLCLFDEHTWGSWNSVAAPDSFDSKGQFAEKAILAYRPLAVAEFALGEANRAIGPKTKGIHVINPYPLPFTGWVCLPSDCLRDNFNGVEEVTTGVQSMFDRTPGLDAFYTIPTELSQFTPMDTTKVFPDNIKDRHLRLWVDKMEPYEVRSFRLLKNVSSTKYLPAYEIEVDETNWPIMVRWEETILFTSAIGDFISLEFSGPFPRWKYKEILALPTVEQRKTERQKHASFTQSLVNTPADVRDTGPTVVYEQYLRHPRLRWACRTLEISKTNPRLQLHLSINRIPKPDSAEIFYVRFPLNCSRYNVQLSNGGLPFLPDKEQLEHSCKDYFAIDDRVTYSRGLSRVVLNCYDNALVALGGMNDGLRLEELNEESNVVYAIIFNNIWYTGFAGDEAGTMKFSFDLYGLDSPGGFAPLVFPIVRV